jgi:hypothetical protein
LVRKSEGNRENFGDPGVDGRKILKLILTKWGVFVWAAIKWLQDWVKGYSGHNTNKVP